MNRAGILALRLREQPCRAGVHTNRELDMARLPLKKCTAGDMRAALAITANPGLYTGRRAVLLTWADEYLRRHADNAPAAKPVQKQNTLNMRRPRANCPSCHGTGFIIWRSGDGCERATRCACAASPGDRAALGWRARRVYALQTIAGTH